MKFNKVSFKLVLFNLMFKIVQRLRQEMVVLFAHKASKFREREHESRDGIRRSRHVDSYSYFPIVWSRSKGGGKKVIKDSMQCFQADIEFPVHIDLLVKRRHSVGMVWGQRLC